MFSEDLIFSTLAFSTFAMSPAVSEKFSRYRCYATPFKGAVPWYPHDRGHSLCFTDGAKAIVTSKSGDFDVFEELEIITP